MLSDITEFSIPAGKVYLSPMIDCFDGMPVSWRISVSPNGEIGQRDVGGCYYSTQRRRKAHHPHRSRLSLTLWPGWIQRMDQTQLRRAMSRKGCSPDNSACEGFFGRMKNEMFYGRSWVDISIEGFTQAIEDYMVWYREKRIKHSLGGMSPLEYRQNLGLCA